MRDTLHVIGDQVCGIEQRRQRTLINCSPSPVELVGYEFLPIPVCPWQTKYVHDRHIPNNLRVLLYLQTLTVAAGWSLRQNLIRITQLMGPKARGIVQQQTPPGVVEPLRIKPQVL